MAIVARDGSWRYQGASLVSTDDQGDAPCCCNPREGCFIILYPICSCPGALAFMVDNVQIQAIWPFEERDSGRVVQMLDGRCYRYIATTPNLPPDARLEYFFQNIAAIVVEGDGSCAPDSDCRIQTGSTIFIANICSVDEYIYDCIESYNYTYSETGFGRLTLEENDPFFEYAISAGTIQSGSFQLGQPGSMIVDTYSRGSRESGSDWDWSESYTTGLGIRSSVDPGRGAVATPENAFDLPPEVWSISTEGIGSNPGRIGHNIDIEDLSYCEQSIRRETINLGGSSAGEALERTSIVKITRTAFSVTSQAFWTMRQYDINTGETLRTARNRTTKRLRYSAVRFTSGIEIPEIEEDNECELDSLVIAYECDAKDPEDPAVQIVVDLAEVPDPGSLIYRAWYEDKLYIVTNTPATGTPAEVIWTIDEECPDPPDPTGDLYRVGRCSGGGFIDITFVPQGPANRPIGKTVAYRPGEGLQPGEGFLYVGLPGANGCIWAIPARPTTEIYEGDPEVVITSRGGRCRGAPAGLIDPRPECQDQDPGPPDPRPSFEQQGGDPGDDEGGLGDLLKQAIDWATMNKLDTCSACDRRRRLVNRWGKRVGNLAASIFGR